jgi:hypothetical protein
MSYIFHKLLNDFVVNYWTETNIFVSVLTFSWIVFVWDLYLSERQVSHKD